MIKIFAPYRICPLGAHIDHQLGIVLGTTIDKGIFFSFTPNNKGKIRLHSLDYNEDVEFPLSDGSSKKGHWSDYARGAVFAIKDFRDSRYGIDGEIKANFPGGGLSSSAAIAVAYLIALEKVNDLEVSAKENIKLVQKLENEYIGLNNGILDQSIILLSNSCPNSMVFLDCKTLEHKIILPAAEVEFEVAVVYSGIEQVLSGTGYNRRVAECEEAAKFLLERISTPGVAVSATPGVEGRKRRLRDVKEEVFHACKDKLPANLRKRATHFFTEMDRVRKGALLWEKGDIEGFGRLMTESGKSSIENYECGTPALIRIYELLNSVDGVYGARFSGAGFRGSCIGLIKPSENVRIAVREKIEKYYLREFPQYAGDCRIAFCKTNASINIS